MTSAAHQVIAPYTQFLGRPPDAVAADLEGLHDLLTTWNRTHNLVSRETLQTDFWGRHVADSLRLLPLIGKGDRLLLDIGSGGGFPALPVAIALKGTARTYQLIEPNARKASFLRTAVRTLAVAAVVHAARAEEIDSRETADVLTARAVAPLDDLLELALPFLKTGSRALFHKGREYGEELRVAAARWRFDVITHEGDAGGKLLEISNLEHNQ